MDEIIGGIILFLSGVIGGTNWTVKILSGGNCAGNCFSDVGPGVALFIVGLGMVWMSKYIAKVQYMADRRPSSQTQNRYKR
jgi:hypothetical protein